jgi:hypothetical protein
MEWSGIEGRRKKKVCETARVRVRAAVSVVKE